MTATAQDVLTVFIKGKGEGSRGGKIIGHTRSGRAVYASGGPARSFGAGHAHFEFAHVEPHGLRSTRDVGGTGATGFQAAIVPLKGGLHARYQIDQVNTDITDGPGGPDYRGSMGVTDPEGHWRVHGPDGRETGHTLDATFSQHPKAKALAEDVTEHARELHDAHVFHNEASHYGPL